ncbi:hypothetical protein BGZ95_008433, partial [Linnemannia exigua]
WGICQLLGEIAINPVWDIATRQQAIALLSHLFKDDRDWGRDESIKAWILIIVTKLGANSDRAVNAVAHALLQDLKKDQCTSIQHVYPLTSSLPISASSSILAKVYNTHSVDSDIPDFQQHRPKDAHSSIYIPPMAKANFQTRDYSPERENLKRPRHHDNPQQLNPQMQPNPDERVRALREMYLNIPSPDIYIEPCGYDKEFGIAKLPDDNSLDAPDPPSRPLMTIAEEFLNE